MWTCGITVDFQAYCWGMNGFGDLGLGNFDDPVASPRAVLMPAASDAPAVGWEEDHSCALKRLWVTGRSLDSLGMTERTSTYHLTASTISL